MGINTKYNTSLPYQSVQEYIDILINKVFALLPKFEDSSVSDENYDSFKIYQNNLIQTINGNMDLINYNSVVVVDILSHLQSLLSIKSHDDYRRHVFKICNLLVILKNEVIKNGL